MTTVAGMTDNRSILQKADLVLSDITSGNGLLLPAQAQKFMRVLIKEATLMKEVTVVPMKAPKQAIEKIQFGQRILRPGKENVALPRADRVQPNFSAVELDAKLFKAEVRLSNEVLEDSIERGELRQTIMQMMAARIATDMDEIILQGDILSSDPTLAQLDGVLKQAVSHVVDAANVGITKSTLQAMLRSMPSEYLRNRKDLRFITSTQSEMTYRDTLAERATVGGDKWLTDDVPVLYGGVPVLSVPMMPETLGGSSNQTAALLCDPRNINVGIWRNIRVETDKAVSEGTLIIVATLRFDVTFAHEPAVVKTINLRYS